MTEPGSPSTETDTEPSNGPVEDLADTHSVTTHSTSDRIGTLTATASTGETDDQYDTERVWTIPNILSLLRLAGVPLFAWLIVSGYAPITAVLVLMVAGVTDWLDGFLARRWHQVSRVGQMLDPIADRLYIVTAIFAMAIRGLIPWWLVIALVLRDVVLALLVPVMKTRGFTSLPVHLVGKIATFCLLYAFPLVLLGDGTSTWALVAKVIGWAFALWGTGLYWWAGLLYLRQTWVLVRSNPTM